MKLESLHNYLEAKIKKVKELYEKSIYDEQSRNYYLAQIDILNEIAYESDMLQNFNTNEYLIKENYYAYSNNKCPICRENLDLIENILGKNGEKYYECTSCEKLFLSKTYLTQINN